MRQNVNSEQFAALNLSLSDREQQEINDTLAMVKTIAAFTAAVPVYLIEKTDNWTRFERCEIKLISFPLDLRIDFNNYRKKFSINWQGMYDFKNCNSHTIEKFKRDLTEPQQIGVLTKKKIQDWANYYYSLYQLLAVEDAKNAEVKEQFLKSIEGLPVKWYNKNTQGSIERNGIEFSFTIGETYVSTVIKLVEYSSRLETWKQLSDNKFVKAQAQD